MKIKIFFLVLLLIVGIVYYQWSGKISKKETTIKATFNCSAGKTIMAEFSNKKVKLVLSDNRKIELPQAISASGARYANNDESFVFGIKATRLLLKKTVKQLLPIVLRSQKIRF